jgi:uncharacterized protein GlcG (DUF336 family)
MNLTLDEAQVIIDRARAHATALGVPMNIAVVAAAVICSRSAGWRRRSSVRSTSR